MCFVSSPNSFNYYQRRYMNPYHHHVILGSQLLIYLDIVVPSRICLRFIVS